MDDVVKKILEHGVQATSGENSQPWEFDWNGDCLKVYKLPHLDNEVYNINEWGTLIAHGALLENIKIAANAMGFGVQEQILPGLQDKDLVAIIRFYPENLGTDTELFDSIYKRSTNRKRFKNIPLTNDEKQKLHNDIEGFEGLSFRLLEEDKQKEKIGQAVSSNERVLLENEEMHKEFFKNIRWTEKEEKEKKTGLYLKTMELAPPQEAVFRLLRNWKIAKKFSKIGFPRVVAKGNSRVYSTGSGIGILYINSLDDYSFVKVGRAVQRLWLRATSLGLSFHPIVGILYLAQRVKMGQGDMFSQAHKDLILAAEQDIRQTAGSDGRSIGMMFRIGHGQTPSARSSKKLPKIR
jgi:hypothetical protein